MRSFMKSRRHSSSSESDVAYAHTDSEQRSSKRNSLSSPTSTNSLSQSNIHHSYMEMNQSPTFEPLSPVRHNKTNFFQRLTKKNAQSILTSPKLETNAISLNKSKSSASLSDQGLPIIQGTITHEWGTPKVVRKGSPIVLDKKPDNTSTTMETPVKDTSSLNLASKNLDSKKKNNRSARIFSNQDFLNLVVDNDEGIELIDKLKTASLNQEKLTPKHMNNVGFLTPQNRSEEFNPWGNDEGLLSPEFSERSRNMSSSSSGSSNDSKFSFQFNSTYGRKSSVKYYGKKEDEEEEDLNSALYFDDIYGDEDFDEDYNVDEEEAYEESPHKKYNKSTTSFGFNNITALTDEEEEGCENCKSDDDSERYAELQSYDIISDSNSILQNDISKIYSEDVDTEAIQNRIICDSGQEKVQAQKKIASFKDLYALTDDDEEEEEEEQQEKDFNQIKDFHKAHNNSVKNESHEKTEKKILLENVITVGKTAVDNMAQIEKPENTVNVKKSQQVTKFNDLYDLSDDDSNDNLEFSDDYYDSFNNAEDLYGDEEDYSELSDLTPRKPPLRFNAESELNNLKTPILTRSPATPVAKKIFSSPLLGKVISNSNMSDTPMLASVLMTPKSPRSPVNRLPPNTILKYHDLTSSLDSGVVPRSMGDLYFIDELEEAHNEDEDDMYLDEINTVPEDFDFENDCDTMSSSRVVSSRLSKNSNSQNSPNGTAGLDSYGGAKKSFGLLKKKSYKGSHSYNEKPTSILKSNKPHPGKVELKNKDKTVTFFHISDHHLQRCNSEPGTVPTRKSNVWRHKSDILANNSVLTDKKLQSDQNFVEKNRTFPNISEEPRTDLYQTSSKFGETNSLSPIQER